MVVTGPDGNRLRFATHRTVQQFIQAEDSPIRSLDQAPVRRTA